MREADKDRDKETGRLTDIQRVEREKEKGRKRSEKD